MNILNLTLQDYLIFFFCLLRMSGLIVFAPFFGGQDFPVRARIGFAVFVSFLAFPYAAQTMSAPLALSGPLLVALTAQEVFVGLVIGFAASLVFLGAQMAGELIGQQLGFSLANIFDPQLEEEVGIISFFQFSLAIVIFFMLNLHLVLLEILVNSYRVVGLGGAVLRGDLIQQIGDMFGRIWTTAIELSGPVLLVMLLVSVVVGMLARTMPQLNILSVGLPAQVFVGLLALYFGAKPFILTMGWLCRRMLDDLQIVVTVLGPARG
jgi:flagellar biosynthesis protein FliR